jgi:nucleotide-binding universal stress UspA family protein
MSELSDDILVELALGLRDDRETRDAVARSPDLRARLRGVESELRSLEDGLDGILAEAALQSPLPSSGWRILLAVDDSTGARRAAATAAVLARVAGEEVEVFHVREFTPGKVGPLAISTRAEAVALVNTVVAGLREGGVTARGEVQEAPLEHVATRILAEAEARRASLIVMSSRSLSVLGALLGKSVSRSVLRHATCPVLIVR